MRTKAFILQEVRRKGEICSASVVKRLKISRQTASQHLRELVSQKKLSKLGTTLDARYVSYGSPRARQLLPKISFKVVKLIKKLNEDKLFDLFSLRLNLPKRLSGRAFRTVRYAFTEMLNNAIDHSNARSVSVEVCLDSNDLEFKVRDKGIGAFESVKRRFHFKDHYEALEHLLKGKQTTDPKRHSGQGIFFTSRAGDLFLLRSARLKWTADNLKSDVSVEEAKTFLRGTEVIFRIRASSHRDLKAVFEAFSNEDYEFDKSQVMVVLSPKQGDYVSRSEAKRLLFGLEKFKRIVFDFHKVRSIGQGFADEIFRVFQREYPTILLETANMVSAVRFMVERARKDKTLQ